jgi:glycosyltransferase involved in cell wall biosynthesis
MEKMALERSSLAFYASHWAANSAIKDYQIDPQKVKVVPFGANMTEIPNYSETQRESNKKIRLLFVGKDWERKGGAIAIETFSELKKAGYGCELIIVGSTVPGNAIDSDIKVYQYLDKANETDKKILYELYTKADFFLLPTRQECYGVVFCEANAFGLPIITTNTGGIPTIVQDGFNGYKLSLEATGKEFAEKIIEIFEQPDLYKQMRFESRKRYDELLNWNSAGKQIQEHIINYINR